MTVCTAGISPVPVVIPDGAMEEIQNCLRDVAAENSVIESPSVKIWWEMWGQRYCPRSNDAIEYTRELIGKGIPYRTPLRDILFKDEDEGLTAAAFSSSIEDYADYNPDFKWPELLAATTNSVQSTLFNPNPPEPRRYANTDMTLMNDLQRLDGETHTYYNVTVTGLRNRDIQRLLKRKCSYSGEEPTLTGNKAALVSRVKEYDTELFIELYRMVSPTDRQAVDEVLREATSGVDTVRNRLISTINEREHITVDVFACLSTGQPVTKRLISGMLELFRQRDSRVADAHRSVNSSRTHYTLYHRSVFCGPDFLAELIENPESPQLLQYFDVNPLTTKRAYCVNCSSDGQGWQLFVIDFDSQCFFFFDPKNVDNRMTDVISVAAVLSMEDREVSKQELCQSANTFVSTLALPNTAGGWRIRSPPFLTAFQSNEDDFNDGIYVLSMIYSCLIDAPMIFTMRDIDRMRYKWAFWLMVGELPL